MPEVVCSPEVRFRTDFPLLCNARGIVDAVEVGTDRGVYASQFLEQFRGNWLYCVDSYECQDEFPSDRSPDMLTAIVALSRYHHRCRLVKARSRAAARWIPTVISPGFVYIDANHEEGAVLDDIDAWWPVLPDGGILAGHDYDAEHPGVMAAVDSFADASGVRIFLTSEERFPPSWYCYKGPEPAPVRVFKEG